MAHNIVYNFPHPPSKGLQASSGPLPALSQGDGKNVPQLLSLIPPANSLPESSLAPKETIGIAEAPIRNGFNPAEQPIVIHMSVPNSNVTGQGKPVVANKPLGRPLGGATGEGYGPIVIYPSVNGQPPTVVQIPYKQSPSDGKNEVYKAPLIAPPQPPMRVEIPLSSPVSVSPTYSPVSLTEWATMSPPTSWPIPPTYVPSTKESSLLETPPPVLQPVKVEAPESTLGSVTVDTRLNVGRQSPAVSEMLGKISIEDNKEGESSNKDTATSKPVGKGKILTYQMGDNMMSLQPYSMNRKQKPWFQPPTVPYIPFCSPVPSPSPYVPYEPSWAAGLSPFGYPHVGPRFPPSTPAVPPPQPPLNVPPPPWRSTPRKQWQDAPVDPAWGGVDNQWFTGSPEWDAWSPTPELNRLYPYYVLAAYPTMIPHPVYYFSDAGIAFFVDGMEYRVHRYFFENNSEFFKSLLSNHPPKKDHLVGINLDMLVFKNEFDTFLEVFYRGLAGDTFKSNNENMQFHEAKSIFKVAMKWGFESVCKRVMKEYAAIASPINRIRIARDFVRTDDTSINGVNRVVHQPHSLPMGVPHPGKQPSKEKDQGSKPDWAAYILEAYKVLCLQGTAINASDARRLGYPKAIMVWEVQEQLRKQYPFAIRGNRAGQIVPFQAAGTCNCSSCNPSTNSQDFSHIDPFTMSTIEGIIKQKFGLPM